MCDLKVYELPLGDITLERMDISNNKHIEALQGMRDIQAKEMCYDVQLDIDIAKCGIRLGNSFMLKDGDCYVAYMAISHLKNGERTIAAIVQQKMRGQGYGKIILTGISEYLLNNKLASSLKLYINKNNLPSIHVAESCDFVYEGMDKDDRCTFSRKS